jgi:hypothetical protein
MGVAVVFQWCPRVLHGCYSVSQEVKRYVKVVLQGQYKGVTALLHLLVCQAPAAPLAAHCLPLRFLPRPVLSPRFFARGGRPPLLL